MVRNLILLFILTFSAMAEKQATITAFTKSKSFFTEQSFILDIIVEKDTQAQIDHIGTIDNASVIFDQSGITKTGTVSRYKIIPHKAGKLTIPAVKAKSRGKEIFTKELTFDVQRPKTRDDIFIKVEIPDNEYYVGEVFPLKVTWFSKLPLYAYRAVECTASLFSDRNIDIFTPFSAPKTGQSKTIGVPISQKRVICKRGKVKMNNDVYEFITFERTARVTVSGEYTFEPIKMITSFIPSRVQTKQQRRWAPTYPSFFNNEFFDDVDNDDAFEKYLIKSKPVTLNILDLPAEGRPADFSGIIGPFKMSTNATPKVLHAGDPLTLNIEMTDHPFIETLEVDPLENNKLIESYFAVNSVQALPDLTEKSLKFSKSIRPLSPDTKQIPALKISYFNPQTKKYDVVETEPIALTVKEAKIVTAFDAELHDGKKLKNELKESPDGIRHNYSSLNDSNSALTSPYTLLKLAVTLPLILFGLFVFLTAGHRRDLKDPDQAVIRNAYKKFKRQNITNIDMLEQVVRQYFSEKLSIPENSHDLKEVLNKAVIELSESEITTLTALYQNSEQKRFNPNAGKTTDINSSDLKNIIKSINGRINNA